MPSYLHAPSDAVCWNCDRRADETISVTLRLPGRGTATFPLCRPCHDETYTALVGVTERAGLTIRRAPPVRLHRAG
jgi:hypothetical protein